ALNVTPYLTLQAADSDTLADTFGTVHTYLPDLANNDGSCDLFLGQSLGSPGTACRLIEDFIPPRRHAPDRSINVLSSHPGFSITGSKPGTPPYRASCTDGESISLTAVAPGGFAFQKWQDEDGVSLGGGALQLQMDDDRVLTAIFVEATGNAPIADAGGPYTAQPGESVTLDASGSTDVDGDIASYSWDIDGDGSFGDSIGVNPVVTSAVGSATVITVRVTDAAGNVDEATSVLSFKQDDVIDWTNLANINASTNALTKSGGGSAWNGNAWSVRALTEPGYVAVSATRGGKRMIGLSLVEGGAAIQTIEYAMYLNIGALEVYESGTHRGRVGTFEDGDELRLTIDGRDIVYSQNGVEIRRVIQAVPAGAYAYQADVSIETNGASLENIRMVIPAPEGPVIDGYIAYDPDNLNTFYSAGDTLTINFHQNTDQAGLSGEQSKVEVDALFSFSPAPGIDYKGAWASAASYVVTVITPGDPGPEIGTATCQVKDSASIFNAKAPLPAATASSPPLSGHFGSTTVLWTELVNVLIEGPKLTRLFATNERWDSGAVSSREVNTNAYFETTVTQLGKKRMIGFGKSNDDATHTDIDYAFFMHFSGALEVYEDGAQTGGLGRYAIGDILKMEIDGLEMKYYKKRRPRPQQSAHRRRVPLQGRRLDAEPARHHRQHHPRHPRSRPADDRQRCGQ
ncbi:MAG: hypothetical protein ACI8W8_001462, partial [Rhodothermales bacterium]